MLTHRVIAVASIVALATVACSSDSSTTTTTSSSAAQPTGTTSTSEPPVESEAGVLAIVDFGFEPSTVTTEPGGALTVTNTGDQTHTFTMDDGSVDQQLASGESANLIVGASGGFHCEIHTSMTGEAIVP